MRAYTRNAAGAQAALVRQAKSAAPWFAGYLRELTLFRAGRRDDEVELDRPGARLDQKPPARARNGGVLAQDAKERAGEAGGAVRLMR